MASYAKSPLSFFLPIITLLALVACRDTGNESASNGSSTAMTATRFSYAPGGISTDGQWLPTNGPYVGGVTAIAVDPNNPATLYMGYEANNSPETLLTGTYKSIDSGATWSRINNGMAGDIPVDYIAIDPTNSDVLYASYSGWDHTYKSIDGGANWFRADYGLGGGITKIIVDPASPSTIYAFSGVCCVSTLYRSTNSGASWSSITLPPATAPDFDVVAGNPSTLYISTSSGLLSSNDGGGSWTLRQPNPTFQVAIERFIIDPKSPSTIYGYTNTNVSTPVLLKSTDSGISWEDIYSNLPTYTTTGSATVERHYLSELVIDPVSSSTLYVSLNNNGIYRSDNGGASWSYASSGAANAITAFGYQSMAVASDAAHTVYYGTYQIGLFKSSNKGVSWANINQPLGRSDITRLTVDPTDSSKLYAGTLEGVYASADGGNHWARASDGMAWVAGHYPQTPGSIYSLSVDPTSPLTLYAYSGQQYLLYKSSDGGGSWHDLPPLANNPTVFDIVVDPAQLATLYLATADAVLKSVDGGAGWYAVNNGLGTPETHSLTIDPTDTSVLYAVAADLGTNSYKIYKTNNGGTSWSDISPVTYGAYDVVLDPSNSAIVYAVTGSGIFKSSDKGATWQGDAQYLATGVGQVSARALVVDPNRPHVLYAYGYGAGDSYWLPNVLWKSVDGGATWRGIASGSDIEHSFYFSNSNMPFPMVITAEANPTVYIGTTGVYAFNDGSDNTPDPFAFTAQSDATTSTEYISNTITVSGINTHSPISITGGEYRIENVPNAQYTSAPGVVYNGDTVTVRLLSSASKGTTVTATLDIGGVSDSYSVTTVPADTTPNEILFGSLFNVALNTTFTSTAVTVSGIDAPAPVSVVGGEYAINGGSYTTAPGSVNNGDTVAVRLQSASTYSTFTEVQLTVGGVVGSFQLTTMVADTTPNAFSFTAVTGAALSTTVSSTPITIAGINAPAQISVVGGEYAINGGSYTAATGTVNNGDSVTVRLTSSSFYSTKTQATLSVGGVSASFLVTTLAGDTTPDPFNFTPVTGATPGATITSNTITVLGINTPTAITVSNGSYSINGGSYTTAPGTVANGDSVTVMVMASSNNSTAVQATVAIGTASATFQVTTAAAANTTTTTSSGGGGGGGAFDWLLAGVVGLAAFMQRRSRRVVME